MEHARRGRPSSRRSSPAGARRTAARGRDTSSTRGREAARAAPGRPSARARRGDRQEPPPPLRGRARPAQPPAHEGTLARVAPRRADLRPAVARPARRRVRRCDVQRRRPRARRGIARRLGPDILAEPPDYDTMLERLRARKPATTGRRRACSTSVSSPASATSGKRNRSGTRASRRGAASPKSPTPSSARRSRQRTA